MAIDLKNYEPAVMAGSDVTVGGSLSVAGSSAVTGNSTVTGSLAVTGAFSLTTQQSANVATNKTVAEADCGVIQNVTVDGVVITLPATTVGMTFIVRNGSSSSGTVGVSISPNALDKIMGNGFTSADNKDAINTKATAKPGDQMVLVADGVNGWFVQSVVGTWAREA